MSGRFIDAHVCKNKEFYFRNIYYQNYETPAYNTLLFHFRNPNTPFSTRSGWWLRTYVDHRAYKNRKYFSLKTARTNWQQVNEPFEMGRAWEGLHCAVLSQSKQINQTFFL